MYIYIYIYIYIFFVLFYLVVDLFGVSLLCGENTFATENAYEPDFLVFKLISGTCFLHEGWVELIHT